MEREIEVVDRLVAEGKLNLGEIQVLELKQAIRS